MGIDSFRHKMEAEGIGSPAIRAFERSYAMLAREETGMIPEQEITPATELPNLDEIAHTTEPRPELLAQTAVLKLNGGLGTGMGLERAKSLLTVRDGLSFLDLIARQVLHFRQQSGARLRFLLMNSFSTSADSRAALAPYSALGAWEDIELLQNKIPKVDAATLEPASSPGNPALEWCPPGHGDLYTVLASNGNIDALIEAGINTVFVSNSDNLGATLDLALLTWFVDSGAPFLMEVTARTGSDRKGGHLALRDGRFILRESAQCPDADMDAFQDIARHRFFNTNNLWLRLDRLREVLRAEGGFLPLPLIRNQKTLDPRDKKSPAVYQLETAMGAAIECFPDAAAVNVSRNRFAPVKTTADLLALRSDAYDLTPDGRAELNAARAGVPPRVELDGGYKLVDRLEAALPAGAPSLLACTSLTINGPVEFAAGVRIEGDVTITNPAAERKLVAAGVYRDQLVTL